MSAYIEAKQASLQRKERFDYNTLANTISNAGNLINDFAQSSANKKAEEWAEKRNTELTNRMQDSDFFKDEEGNWLDFNRMKEKINSFNEEYLLENPLTKIYGTRDKAFSLTKNKDNEVTLLAQKYYIDNIKQEQAIKAEEAFNNILNTEVKDFALETEMLIDVGGYENGYSEEQIEWATNAIYGEDTDGNTKYLDFKCFKLSVELKSLGYKDADISKIVAKARDEFAVDIFTDLLVDKYVNVLDGTDTQWDYDKFVTDSINLGEIPGYSKVLTDEKKVEIKNAITAEVNGMRREEEKKTAAIYNDSVFPLLANKAQNGILLTSSTVNEVFNNAKGFNCNFLPESTRNALRTMMLHNDDVETVKTIIDQLDSGIGNFASESERKEFVASLTKNLTTNQIGIFYKAMGITPYDGSFSDFGIDAEFNKQFGLGANGNYLGGISGSAYTEAFFEGSESFMYDMKSEMGKSYKNSVNIKASTYVSLGQWSNAEKEWDTYYSGLIADTEKRLKKERKSTDEIKSAVDAIKAEQKSVKDGIEASRIQYEYGQKESSKVTLDNLKETTLSAELSEATQLANNELAKGNIDIAESIVANVLTKCMQEDLKTEVPGSNTYNEKEAYWNARIGENKAFFQGKRDSEKAAEEKERNDFIYEYQQNTANAVSVGRQQLLTEALNADKYSEALDIHLEDIEDQRTQALIDAGDDEEKKKAVNSYYDELKKNASRYYGYLESQHIESERIKQEEEDLKRQEEISQYTENSITVSESAKLSIALSNNDLKTAKEIELTAAERERDSKLAIAKTAEEENKIIDSYKAIKKAIEDTYAYKEKVLAEEEAEKEARKIEQASLTAQSYIDSGNRAFAEYQYDALMKAGKYEEAKKYFEQLYLDDLNNALDDALASGLTEEHQTIKSLRETISNVETMVAAKFEESKKEYEDQKAKEEAEKIANAIAERDNAIMLDEGAFEIALLSCMVTDGNLPITTQENAEFKISVILSGEISTGYKNVTNSRYTEIYNSMTPEEIAEFEEFYYKFSHDPTTSPLVKQDALAAWNFQKKYGVTDIDLSTNWVENKIGEIASNTIASNTGFIDRNKDKTVDGRSVFQNYENRVSDVEKKINTANTGFANKNDLDAVSQSNAIKNNLLNRYQFGLISKTQLESEALKELGTGVFTEDDWKRIEEVISGDPMAILADKFPDIHINEIIADAIGGVSSEELTSYLKGPSGLYYTEGLSEFLLGKISLLNNSNGAYTSTMFKEDVESYIRNKDAQKYKDVTSLALNPSYSAFKLSWTADTPPTSFASVSNMLKLDDWEKAANLGVNGTFLEAVQSEAANWSSNAMKGQTYQYEPYIAFLDYDGKNETTDVMAVALALNAFAGGSFSFVTDNDDWMNVVKQDVLNALYDLDDTSRASVLRAAQAFKVQKGCYNSTAESECEVSVEDGQVKAGGLTVEYSFSDGKPVKETVVQDDVSYDLQWTKQTGIQTLNKQATNLLVKADLSTSDILVPEGGYAVLENLVSNATDFAIARDTVEALEPGMTIVPYVIEKSGEVRFAKVPQGESAETSQLGWSYCGVEFSSLVAKSTTYIAADYGFKEFIEAQPEYSEAVEAVKKIFGSEWTINITGLNHDTIEVVKEK